jgi:hypothetical protein
MMTLRQIAAAHTLTDYREELREAITALLTVRSDDSRNRDRLDALEVVGAAAYTLGLEARGLAKAFLRADEIQGGPSWTDGDVETLAAGFACACFVCERCRATANLLAARL